MIGSGAFVKGCFRGGTISQWTSGSPTPPAILYCNYRVFFQDSILGRDGEINGEQNANECRYGGQNDGEKHTRVVALSIESGTHLEKIEERHNEQDEA